MSRVTTGPLPTEPAEEISPEWAAAIEGLREGLDAAVGKVCPPALAAHRDDLVQAAWIKVVRLGAKNEGKTTFSASYLRRAAYSALIDEIRRHRRRREEPLEGDMAITEPTHGAPSPERRAFGGELGQAIVGCLDRLVRPRRLAVVLHLQGHSVPEIASRLGWVPKRAENLVYRGLKNLRGCLMAKGLEP